MARKRLVLTLCLAAASVVCLGSRAFAGQTVTMEVTNPGNNILGGVYVGPYYATIGSQTNVPIICDDFTDETYVGSPWSATVTTVAAGGPTWMSTSLNLSAAMQAADYAQAAYLAEQLVSPSVACPSKANCTGDIQFAIWNIFDPSTSNGHGGYLNGPLSYISGNDLSNSLYWLQQASSLYQKNALSTAQFSNVTVYSPYPKGPPQEFLRVNTPEAPVLATLGVDLLLFAVLAFFVRRRMPQSVA